MPPKRKNENEREGKEPNTEGEDKREGKKLKPTPSQEAGTNEGSSSTRAAGAPAADSADVGEGSGEATQCLFEIFLI